MERDWEKLYHEVRAPHVVVLPKPYAGAAAGARMFVASPALIEARMRAVAPGRTLEVPALRAELARENRTDACCPVSTSIFLRIVAERALIRLAQGRDGAPFWRVIPPESPIARKLSCGPDFIRERREEEAAQRATARQRKAATQ
jgi:hypothetical protein